MTLSKRERYIVIITVAVVGILGLDRFFVSPLLARMDEAKTKIESSERELTQQERDITNARRARRKWATASGGTVKRDAPEVESLIAEAVRNWAGETRMSFTGFRPFGTDKEKGFTRITYVVTGAGSMEQIGRVLHKIQTAKIPVRIMDLQISPKTREGVDDLNVSLKVSSIIETPDADKNKQGHSAQQRDSTASWN